MNKQLLKSNIWKYYLFNGFREFLFFVPTIVLFWQSNGLNFTQIMLLQSLFAMAIVLLEVPTGAVADKIGRKQSIYYGTVFMIASLFVYGSSSLYYQFIIAESLWALGISLISGADSALLFDSLKLMKKDDEYKKHEGNAKAIMMIFAALGAAIGGHLGAWSYRSTFFVSSISIFICFILALNFKEPEHITLVETPKYWELIFQSFKFVLKHKLMRWYLIMTGIFAASNGFLWAYQPYMQLAGIDIKYFGYAFALFNIVAAISSKLTDNFERFFGKFKSLAVLSIFLIIPFFTMPFIVAKFSFLFIIFHQIIRGIFNPIMNHAMLEYTFADKRATVLSIRSLAARLVYAMINPFLGWMIDAYSLLTAIWMFGIILTALLVISFIMYFFIPNKYFEVKGEVKKKQ